MGKRCVVTGASRGLGLEFCRQFLGRGYRVVALARHVGEARELRELANDAALTIVTCDVGDPASIALAAVEIDKQLDGVDLLINNAGVMGRRDESLRSIDYARMDAVFETNVYGPMRVTAALLDLLRQGDSPKVVHITSKMGSIDDNTSGGYWSYRMSKAALNMVCMNMAHELRTEGIDTMVLHPGWVATDMGGLAAPTSGEDSVRGMIDVIDELGMTNSGCFRDFTGAPIPW